MGVAHSNDGSADFDNRLWFDDFRVSDERPRLDQFTRKTHDPYKVLGIEPPRRVESDLMEFGD